MKKRIMSFALCLLILLGAFFVLSGCNKEEEVKVPAGMQLAGGGTALGYYLFAPSEWTVSGLGNISAAFASNLDNSSVSLSACDFAEGESAVAYFDRTMAQSALPVTVTVHGDACILGNADAAWMFVYTAQYGTYPFRFLTVIATFGENAYLFTYAASDAKRHGSDLTYYDYWKGSAEKVMENVLFVTPGEKDPPRVPGEADAHGYRVVSDPGLSGFTFRMPDGWECVLSSGIVQVRTADGADVNMTEATRTGVAVGEYWKTRKEELSVWVGDLTLVREGEPCDFANAAQAVCYEYTYTYRGREYHVYQVLAIAGARGYVFTYTAPEEIYATYLPQVLKMAQKAEF